MIVVPNETSMPVRAEPMVTNPGNFRIAKVEGHVARVFLGIAIAATLWHVISGELPLRKAVTVDPRRSSFRRQQFAAAEDHYHSTWLISFLVFVVAAIPVIWWAKRAYVNRQNQDLSPGQIVIALMIPMANIYVLHQLLTGFTTSKQPHRRPVAKWAVGAMSVLAVLATVLTFIETQVEVSADGGTPGLVAMFIAASLMQVAAMALLIYLIGGVNRIQNDAATQSDWVLI